LLRLAARPCSCFTALFFRPAEATFISHRFRKKIFSLIFNDLADFWQTKIGVANGNLMAERISAMHVPIIIDTINWIIGFLG
jgi:hypothetical protein